MDDMRVARLIYARHVHYQPALDKYETIHPEGSLNHSFDFVKKTKFECKSAIVNHRKNAFITIND